VKPSNRNNGIPFSGKNSKLHCLITGFDTFAGSTYNVSQAVVESLPKRVKLPQQKGDVNLNTLVLPTCGDLAWKELKKRLDKLPRQSVVILTGMAAPRPNISVERFALNIKDYRVMDNAGCLVNGQEIAARGPAALKATLDPKAIVEHVLKKGLCAEVSNFCGTFVCNEIYFQGLRYQKSKGLPHILVFVHLPLPVHYGKRLRMQGASRFHKLSRNKSNQLLAMQKALLEIAKFLLQQVS
jgi:pyroglutamyl-peptidase